MLNRKVILWVIVLLLVTAAVGGYTVMRMWARRDAILLEGIRAEVAKKAPDWDVGIEEAKLVNTHEVWIGGFTIKPRGETIPVLDIPECYVTVDPDLLLKDRQLLIRKLRVPRPTVTLIRHADGTWNWQKLGRPAPSQQTPEIEVESGSIVVRVEAAAGVPEAEIANRDVALVMLPSGLHRYLIEGASQIDGAGGLSFSGKIDLDSGAWELAGQADGLDMSPSLLKKAAALSPAVGRKVAELSGPNTSVIPGAVSVSAAGQDHRLIQPASQVEQSRSAADGYLERRGVSQLSLPNLGLVANIALEFQLQSDGEQKIPDYRVVAKVMEGQVAEPLSPVPLSGLQGELLLENDRIAIRRVSAEQGDSQLFLDGEVSQQEGETARRFSVRATNLWLDPQVRELLPPERQKLFDLINPSGRFSIEARYDSEAAKPLKLDKLIAHDCSIRHELFPYPVEGISGRIEQDGQRLTLSLRGTAADRPVRIEGEIHGASADGEIVLHIQADRFPIDERFTNAIVAPEHQSARKAIESLNLTGLADLRVQFARRAGADERFRMSLDADVSEATMSYRKFPYAIEQLSGHVHFDPWKEPVWRFTDLKGRHGAATLDGEATFDLTEQPGQLKLIVNARNGTLDERLKYAMVAANPQMSRVWSELNPSGVIHIDRLAIVWVPGEPPEIELPSIQWQRGSMVPCNFPYRWDDVTAEFAWKDGRVDLWHAAGRRGETTILINGRNKDKPAYFRLADAEDFDWVLHLPEVTVRNLIPHGDFADALPDEVAAVLTKLDPRGPIDAVLGVEMAGWPEARGGEIVTSDWDLFASLKNDQLNTGLKLTDVTGSVEAHLRWDGERVVADGRVDLEQARTLEMTCTQIRGPFSVNGSELTIGSASILRGLKAPSDEQLTASLYGGTVKVNSIVRLNSIDVERTTYEAQVDVENADLSQWAREWGAAEYNVAGTVNGLMHLNGLGSSPLALRGDNCWLTVTDARLGELPQIAQLLGQIMTQLQQPDKTAFRYAYAEFSIANGRFEFGSPVSPVPGDTRRILFDGNTFRMVGRGVIPFADGIDPQMNLVFFLKMADRMPNIPLITPILRSTFDNWLRVEVRGVPSAPHVQTLPQVPIGNVNEALREIFTTPMPIVR